MIMGSSASPLDKTFAVLANSSASETEAVLLRALASSIDTIAQRAARCICAKPTEQRVAQAMKQSESLSQVALDEFARAEERLSTALKQPLQSAQADLRTQTLEFVRRAGLVSQLSVLLQQVDQASNPFQAQTSEVARDLVTRLAYRLAGKEELGGLKQLSDESVRQIQMQLLNELDRRCEKFDDLHDQELFVECILLLGQSHCTAVKNLLDKRGSAGRHMVKTVLQKASHPHLIDLVCESLTHKEPHQKLQQVFVSRDDAVFVNRLLEWLPTTITGDLEKNLRNIDELPWLSLTHATWLEIPLDLHAKLVSVINAVNLPVAQARELKKWILTNSGPEGRAAAGDLFKSLDDEESQQVLYEALADENPEVEAWATHQLRSQKVPDAFDQLIKRLEATNDIVREAARDELADFNLKKMWDYLAKMPDGTAIKCGQLLKKINPNTTVELREELQDPRRWKRLRGARAAAALGMVDEVLATIGQLFEKGDSTERRTAIEALQYSQSSDAKRWIERALKDSTRSVREAAQRAQSQS